MRNIYIVLFTLVFLLSLVGCENQNILSRDETNTSTSEEQFEQIGQEILQYPGQNSDYKYYVYETYVEIVQYIGENTEVFIPDEIESKPVRVIGENAFRIVSGSSYRGNTSLQSVTMTDNILLIKEYAFFCCVNLAAVRMSSNLQVIERKSFDGCEWLVKVILPEGIKEIGEYAFANCTNLCEINIPRSVSKIGIYAIGWNGNWDEGHLINEKTCITIHKASYGLNWVLNQKYEQLTNYRIVD